jgi:hypothetical protein
MSSVHLCSPLSRSLYSFIPYVLALWDDVPKNSSFLGFHNLYLHFVHGKIFCRILKRRIAIQVFQNSALLQYVTIWTRYTDEF